MTNMVNALQPAIDALEKDLADLERQGNALLTSINLLRAKAGLPPRPGAWTGPSSETAGSSDGGRLTLSSIHSDTFLGKRMGSAAREYLAMRKASGGNAPATTREVFNALKDGGFVFGAKDDATAIVVLRAMLRKNTQMFYKLPNGTYGLRSWYPDLKRSKAPADSDDDKAPKVPAGKAGEGELEDDWPLDETDKPAVA